MGVQIFIVEPDEPIWPRLAALFPRQVEYMRAPGDAGNYTFFAAVDEGGAFLGGCVIDIGPLRFGPLGDRTAGFLENVEVPEAFRRRGIGARLLRTALAYAWEHGAESVRWTVPYENTAALALYDKVGCTFVPEEDPAAPETGRYYTVVAANPGRVGGT